MNTPTVASLSLALLLSLAHAAHPSFAHEAPNPSPRPADATAQRFDQVLYKGVVGNLLDAVPMNPEQRTTLQRTNAIVSGALSGKSLASLAKLAHPGFLIGGLAWGLWSASNIEQTPMGTATESPAPPSTTANDEVADIPVSDDGVTRMPATVAPVAPPVTHRPQVVRVWLPPSAY